MSGKHHLSAAKPVYLHLISAVAGFSSNISIWFCFLLCLCWDFPLLLCQERNCSWKYFYDGCLNVSVTSSNICPLGIGISWLSFVHSSWDFPHFWCGKWFSIETWTFQKTLFFLSLFILGGDRESGSFTVFRNSHASRFYLKAFFFFFFNA